MDLDSLIGQLAKDLEWFFFYAHYCTGRNIDQPFCRDFEWWALGAGALVAAILAWWIAGKLSGAWRGWRHRRALAKVADAETMRKHLWSGYDSPDAVPSSEQRAGKDRNSTK